MPSAKVNAQVRRRAKPAGARPPRVVMEEDEEVLAEGMSFGAKCFFLATLVLSFVLLLVLTVVAAAALYPCDIEPVSYDVPTPPDPVGALAPNKHLLQAEKLLVGEVVGPESLVYKDGFIYSGTADGKIVRMDPQKKTVETVVEFGIKPCGTFSHEPTCGRPLGLRFAADGHLIVIDTYLGLFKVNVTSKEVVKLLLSPKVVGSGPMKFLNDLDIDPADGAMYISDSSIRFQRRNYYSVIMDGLADGRLLRFDPKNNQIDIVIDNLAFPNGVQMTHDGQAVLVAEGLLYRIWKYHIRGPKAGQKELFAENMPGFIDNIRKSKSGGYWLGLAMGRLSNHFAFLDFFAKRPFARKMIYNAVSPSLIVNYVPKYGILVEIDDNGQIVRSLQDPTGKHLNAVSEIEEVDGTLYFGSFMAPYLAKLDLNKLEQ
eukprot:GHVU01059557.1.p1 GENE.GHVU01059557.1~~GHVU01059557.1.p1  ORF type:complete len:428 (-),score=40.76 GHVU01059557.1:198-1481(-)